MKMAWINVIILSQILSGSLVTPFRQYLHISEANMAAQVSKKRKFVADGVFKAELNEFLTRELAEDGYSGVEVSAVHTT